MIDEQFKVYLIEVNTNPCLDTSPCALLHRLITTVLDQTFKLCVDPFYCNPDLKKQEAQYGLGSGTEMSLQNFMFEMVVSNQQDIAKNGLPERLLKKPPCGDNLSLIHI